MKRSLTVECLEKIGQEVKVAGWVHTVRAHGKIAFFDLKDRSGLLQITALHPSLVSEVTQLGQQDVVEVSGTVKKREEKYINLSVASGTIELEAKEINLLSKAKALPFDMATKDLHLELPTLLDNRSITLRHPKISAIFKIQEAIVDSFRNTLKKENFTEIFVPTIVPVATEGGAEVFSVDYYGHRAYLGQSPQLYKQIMVSIFERVFTVAHAYRAEPSVTTRHLSEYVSMDAEFGFISSWQEIMDMAEKVISSILESIEEKNEKEMRLLEASVPQIDRKIPRVKLKEAQEILFKRTKIDHRNEPDLDPKDEAAICQWAEEETGSPFVFITHYPTKKRPFYTMPDSEDPEYTLSFDLLGINEEWVTGGQRIHDFEMLLSRIKERGNKPQDFSLYLQAFKYGMPPEGGFAIGLERLTKDILGIGNVREASLFPRDMERVDERLSKNSSKGKNTR